MNPIQYALSQGHSASNIINFLISSYPELGKKIQRGLSSGYAPDQILDFFLNLDKTSSISKGTSQQSIHRLKREEDIEKNKKLIKKGALAFGSGLLATKALPPLARGISNVASNLTQQISPSPKPELTAQAPIDQSMQPLEPVVPLSPSISQLSKEAVDELLESGQKITPQTQQLLAIRLSKLHNIPMREAYQEINKLINADNSSLTAKSIERQFQNREEVNNEEPIVKAKMVAFPNGEVGTVSEERQGIGSIELPDGTRRTRKLNELVESPEDAAVTALELIKSFTPEQDRSSHHTLNFYDEDEQSAYFVFHNGSAYRVDNISPEEYERLSQEVDQAKTSGENPYGAWASGEGSRGAAYNEIVKKLNKPYRKLRVGYNILKEWQRLVHERQKKERKRR